MKKKYWVILLTVPWGIFIILKLIFEETGSIDGWLGFLGGYGGIGGSLLVCFFTLESQKKQFEKEKKEKEEEKEKYSLNSYKILNHILNSLLKKKKTEFLSEDYRYLYSFIFIASPTLYSKNYFFLSEKQLNLLELHIQHIDHIGIRKNITDIVSYFFDINLVTKDIIKNSHDISFKFNDCLDFTKNLKKELIKEEYKNLKICDDKIEIMNKKMEDISKNLSPPCHLLNPNYGFSSESIVEKKVFLDTIEKMKELFTFFTLFEREISIAFLGCIKTIILMIPLIYIPNEKELYSFIYSTSEMINNEIKNISKKYDITQE